VVLAIAEAAGDAEVTYGLAGPATGGMPSAGAGMGAVPAAVLAAGRQSGTRSFQPGAASSIGLGYGA
jgi:hypothetical protein